MYRLHTTINKPVFCWHCSLGVMKQVKQHVSLIRHLTLCTPRQCKAIVSTASKEQITALSCVCLNTLNGYFPLNTKDKKTLLPYRRRIHALASKKTSLQQKRKLMSDKFLKTLLKIVLPGLQLALNG